MSSAPARSTERTVSDDPAVRADEAATRRTSGRARMSDPAVRAEVRRRKRRHNRIALGVGALVAVALVAYLAVYFLPIMAVRTIAISGVPEDQREQISAAAQVEQGTPLLQVDSRQVARRIAGIPNVSEVRVVRNYPSTLRIEVIERVPAAWIRIDGAVHVFDADGVDFQQPGEPPAGTLEISLGATADEFRSQAVREAATISATLQTATAARGAAQDVIKIHSDSPQGYVLTLADGRVIEWGSAERTQEKADAFAVVMDRPGQTWNVANPTMPVSRG